jgi:uncharacterized membrane protein YjgN (DUF898 family)
METNVRKLTFSAKGGNLFVIYLENMLLSLITLGIYSFWGRVNVIRFLYNHTRYLDEPFDYHATGKERFIGFLKAVGIFIIFYIVIIAMAFIMGLFFNKEVAGIILLVFIYGVILAAIPLILVGRERFRQSRSSWKSIRFRFTGSPKELMIIFLKGLGLSIITLGIYSPWFYCNMRRYFITHSNFGNQAFDFHGTGDMLVKTFFVGLVLTIITFGIYGSWWMASLQRFTWGNTSMQGKRFATTITGGDLFVTALLSGLLVVFTLGIGFPWAVIMNMRVILENLGLEDGVDFASIKSDFDAKATALSDGLADAADALDSVGSIFS